MGFENGVGFKVVKTLPTKPTTKSYIKVKQATDLNLKNYMNVKETVGVSKDYTEVMLVDYDYPKDYLLVNYLGVERHHTFDGVDDYLNLGVLSDRPTISVELTFSTTVAAGALSLFGCSLSEGIYLRLHATSPYIIQVYLPNEVGAGWGVVNATFSFSLRDGEAKDLVVDRVSQDTVNVSVNGETKTLTFPDAGPVTLSGDFWVGAAVSGTKYYFDGEIYDVSVDGVIYKAEDTLVNG